MKRSLLTIGLFLVLIGATTVMAQTPDLRIAPNYGTTPGSGFNILPADPADGINPGETVQVQFRVRNFGTGPSTLAYGTLRWNSTGTCTASDNQLGSYFSIPALAPSALTTVYTRTITVPSGVGTRYICGHVDVMNSGGQPLAARANDLFASPAFAVVAAVPPSITPQTVLPSAASVAPGAAITLDYDLIAAGTPAPSSSGYVTVRLSGVGAACSLGDATLKNVGFSGVVAASNPNTQQDVPVTIPVSTTAGARNICVWNGSLVASAPLTVTAPVVAAVNPDNVTLDKTQLPQGGQMLVAFDVEVTNPPATAGMAIIRLKGGATCSTGDVQLGQVPYSGTTNEAKSLTVTIPPSTPVGTGKRICVWAGGTTVPTNVAESAVFEVTSGAPNLLPSELQLFGPETTARPNDASVPVPHIMPATFMAGDTISVQFRVTNTGNFSAGSSLAAIRFHQDPIGLPATPCSISDNLLAYVMVPTIAGGVTVDVLKEGIAAPAGLPANSVHKICVYVDDSNSAGQTTAGRANDLISEIIVHGALPDLVPVNVLVDSSAVTTATVTFNVYNQGRGISNITRVLAYLSDHATLEDHVLGTDNDTPLVITGSDDPCGVPLPVDASRPVASQVNPEKCVPALASGETSVQYTIAEIPIENLWTYIPEGEATANGDGTYRMTAITGGDYSAVSLVPGRYLWIVVDDNDVAGQVLPELEANDTWSDLLDATPVTVSDLNSLKVVYTLNAGHQETAFDGSENNYPNGSTPYVGISVSGDYSDWVWAWFTALGSNEPPSFAEGSDFELIDASARFGYNQGPDNMGMTWTDVLNGGGPIGTPAQGSKTISAISLIMYNAGVDEDIDITLQGINVGLVP